MQPNLSKAFVTGFCFSCLSNSEEGHASIPLKHVSLVFSASANLGEHLYPHTMADEGDSANWETVEESVLKSLARTPCFSDQKSSLANNVRVGTPAVRQQNPYGQLSSAPSVAVRLHQDSCGIRKRWSQLRYKAQSSFTSTRACQQGHLRAINEGDELQEGGTRNEGDVMKNSTICEGGVPLSATVISGLSPIIRKRAEGKQICDVQGPALTPFALQKHCVNTSPDPRSKVEIWLASTRSCILDDQHVSKSNSAEVKSLRKRVVTSCDDTPPPSCYTVMKYALNGKGKRRLKFRSTTPGIGSTVANDALRVTVSSNRATEVDDPAAKSELGEMPVDIHVTSACAAQGDIRQCRLRKPDTSFERSTKFENESTLRIHEAPFHFMVHKPWVYRSLFAVLPAQQASEHGLTGDSPSKGSVEGSGKLVTDDVLKLERSEWIPKTVLPCSMSAWHAAASDAESSTVPDDVLLF